jgi:hypothetical protein
LPPDPFRRPKYRGPRANPTESPGSTRAGRRLGRRRLHGEGDEYPESLPGGEWGLSAPGSKMGVGFLSGRARAHQFVVALDFQLAAVEYCVVAQVGVKTDILAGRRVLVSGESAIAVGPSLPFPFIPNDSRHSVTAMRLRSLLPACWPWCQRRTHSRQTP